MKVYILFETKDTDEYGFGQRDDVVGVFLTRKKAERELRRYEKIAELDEQDYTYNIISEEIK